MALVFAAGIARGHAKPDFSGTWTIVPGSGQPNGAGGLGQKFTLVQTDKTITIQTSGEGARKEITRARYKKN